MSRLKLDLRYPDADTAAATQQLLFVVREPPNEGNPCDPLWGPAPSGLAEFSRLVDYPNRNDVVAAPLDVGRYTVFVYAYSSPIDRVCTDDSECSASATGKNCRTIGGDKQGCVDNTQGLVPIAGGCAGGEVPANEAAELTVTLEKKPG